MAIIVTEDSKGMKLNIKGRALWPKLTTPDTHFDPAGVYTTKLIINEADQGELQSILAEAREQGVQIAVDEAAKKGRKVKPESIKLVDLPLQELTDRETGEGTGEWSVSTKCKASGTSKDGRSWERKVPLFDAKAKAVTNPQDVEIWTGSMLNVQVRVKPFFSPALGAGVSLPLLGVQILQLSNGSRDASAFGFATEEDGYSYEDLPEGDIPFAADDSADNDGGAEADF